MQPGLAQSCAAGWRAAAAILWFWVRVSVLPFGSEAGSQVDPFLVPVAICPGLCEAQQRTQSAATLRCTGMLTPTCSCARKEVGDRGVWGGRAWHLAPGQTELEAELGKRWVSSTGKALHPGMARRLILPMRASLGRGSLAT